MRHVQGAEPAPPRPKWPPNDEELDELRKAWERCRKAQERVDQLENLLEDFDTPGPLEELGMHPPHPDVDEFGFPFDPEFEHDFEKFMLNERLDEAYRELVNAIRNLEALGGNW